MSTCFLSCLLWSSNSSWRLYSGLSENEYYSCLLLIASLLGFLSTSLIGFSLTFSDLTLDVWSFLITQEMCLTFPHKTLLPKNVSTMVPTFLLSAIYFPMFSVRQKFILTLQLEQVKTFLLDRKTKYPRRDWVTESMKNVNKEEKAFRIRRGGGECSQRTQYHIFTAF